MKNKSLERIKEEIQEMKNKKSLLAAELGGEIPHLFKDIFEKTKHLQSFSWNQYTPYFNDGDTCEFAVNVYDVDSIAVNNYYPYEEEDDDELLFSTEKYNLKKLQTSEDLDIHKEICIKESYGNYYLTRKLGDEGWYYNEKYDEDLANAKKEIYNILKEIPEDLLEELYGDHVEVTIKANGLVETKPYDHD